MTVREHGMRRIALATTGLVAVSAAGTAVLAAVAYADTRADRGSSSTATTSTSTSPTATASAGSSSSSGSSSSTDSDSGPSVSSTTGDGQATTAGS
jgi:hypothetical protein